MTKIKQKNRNIDWVSAKKYYISHTECKLSDIAKKYGCTVNGAQRRSSVENWVALRKKTISESEIKLLDNVSDKLAETNQKHASTYRQAQSYINRRLQLAMAKAQELENSATKSVKLGKITIPLIDDSKLMSPQQISFLITALKTAVDGERVALGLPTTVTKSENDFNINDPFADYNEDQLRRIIEITDAEIKSARTQEAELAS